MMVEDVTEEATWEDYLFMQTQAQLSSVEDNTCLKGRGMLSPRKIPIQSPMLCIKPLIKP
jgi:hypothetical protein